VALRNALYKMTITTTATTTTTTTAAAAAAASSLQMRGYGTDFLLRWVTVFLPEGTHPTTNRAECSATALIETNALPLFFLH